jgi:hypothetical protein
MPREVLFKVVPEEFKPLKIGHLDRGILIGAKSVHQAVSRIFH